MLPGKFQIWKQKKQWHLLNSNQCQEPWWYSVSPGSNWDRCSRFLNKKQQRNTVAYSSQTCIISNTTSKTFSLNFLEYLCSAIRPHSSKKTLHNLKESAGKENGFYLQMPAFEYMITDTKQKLRLIQGNSSCPSHCAETSTYVNVVLPGKFQIWKIRKSSPCNSHRRRVIPVCLEHVYVLCSSFCFMETENILGVLLGECWGKSYTGTTEQLYLFISYRDS